MQDILAYTDFGVCEGARTLTPQQRFEIETLLTKLPHKLLTSVTDINPDEIVIRTRLFNNSFIIIYNRDVTHEYKWTISNSTSSYVVAHVGACLELLIVHLYSCVTSRL